MVASLPRYHKLLDCMAARINPSSSSSFKHGIRIPTGRFTTVSYRTCHTSNWVSQISSRNHVERHLVLKSSNGYPLNAVPLQDGEFLIPKLPSLSFYVFLGEMDFWLFPACNLFLLQFYPCINSSLCLKKRILTSQCSITIYVELVLRSFLVRVCWKDERSAFILSVRNQEPKGKLDNIYNFVRAVWLKKTESFRNSSCCGLQNSVFKFEIFCLLLWSVELEFNPIPFPYGLHILNLRK